MAFRPVFVPKIEGRYLVTEVPIEFKWHPGMAPSQKKKNVTALHESAKARGLQRILEISSKSELELGRRLSAFSLKLEINGKAIGLEAAYQGSKVFEGGGPYEDIFDYSPREAKRDIRLKNSGRLKKFTFLGSDYPLVPKNAFYDWLYIRSLTDHEEWIAKNVEFDGFTDIEFNPEKSINCQARAFAEYVSLSKKGLLSKAVDDFSFFANLLSPI